VKKTEPWLWIGAAFLAGALLGSLTTLPLSFVGWQSKFPIGQAPVPSNP